MFAPHAPCVSVQALKFRPYTLGKGERGEGRDMVPDEENSGNDLKGNKQTNKQTNKKILLNIIAEYEIIKYSWNGS